MAAPEIAERPLLRSVRSVLAAAALIASAVVLAKIFDKHEPIERWLFWRYAMAWVYVVYFCAAALSTGNLIARVLSRPGERSDGHVTVSFATGVYAFFLVMFVVGVAGWLTTATFFLV